MSLEKSQKIVKVLGILSIIGAVASFIVALGMFGLGGSGAANMAANDDNAATGVAVVIVLGVVMLVEGVVSLVQGVFSLQAAKDATKAQPLWIISIIGVVLAVLSVIASFTNNGGQDVLTKIFSLIISCFTFYLANNIKKLGSK